MEASGASPQSEAPRSKVRPVAVVLVIAMCAIVWAFTVRTKTETPGVREESPEAAQVSPLREPTPLRPVLASTFTCQSSPQVHHLQVPIFTNVKVESKAGEVVLHYCGAPKDQVKSIEERIRNCRGYWKDFTSNRRSKSMAPIILVFHESLGPCRGNEDRRCGAVLPESDDFLWLMARWGMDNQYHGLFEQGLFQTWVTYQDLVKAQVIPQHLLRSSRVPFVVVKDMFYKGYQPFQDLWPVVLPVRRVFRVPPALSPSTPTSAYPFVACPSKLVFSHYDWHPYDMIVRWNALDGKYREKLGEFALDVRDKMRRRFGAVKLNESFPVLFDNRTRGTYETYFRARGIEPALKKELDDVLTELVGPSTTKLFSASMSLEEQWRILQSKKVVVAGEGAFFAWSMFAAENATWICVSNHTRPPKFDIRVSNWHAGIASAYPFLRFVVYMIDHGRREPVSVFRYFFPVSAGLRVVTLAPDGVEKNSTDSISPPAAAASGKKPSTSTALLIPFNATEYGLDSSGSAWRPGVIHIGANYDSTPLYNSVP